MLGSHPPQVNFCREARWNSPALEDLYSLNVTTVGRAQTYGFWYLPALNILGAEQGFDADAFDKATLAVRRLQTSEATC
jgi:hypothetical protein